MASFMIRFPFFRVYRIATCKNGRACLRAKVRPLEL
jgi:hypothetical protein